MKNLIMILISFGTVQAFAAEDTLANAIAAALQDGVDSQSKNVVAKISDDSLKSAMVREHNVTVIKVENTIDDTGDTVAQNATHAPQTDDFQEEVVEDVDLVKQLKELRD